MPEPREIKQGERFDRIAEEYDQSPDQYPVRGRVRDESIRVVQLLGSKNVLDAGCGTGTVLLELAKSIDKGLGVDISRRMLEVAKQKSITANIINVDFIHSSLMDLSEAFLHRYGLPHQDAIVSTYAMHHLSQAERRDIISKLVPMLAPGGSLVIGDLMFFEDPLKQTSDFHLVGYDPQNDNPESAESLEAMLHDAGLITHFIKMHPLAGIFIGTRLEELDR